MNLSDARLLVVDDEPANTMLLARIFERENHVDIASNGYQALEFIASQPYDIVLLDIMMGQLSGLDVLEQVRQTKSKSDLPIILISALSDGEDITRGLQLGANDYIGKPFDYDVLMARTISQVELRRAVVKSERLTEELRVANEIKRNMMQIASHDLKSPIQNISLVHGMLEEQFHDDPDAMELLAIAKGSTKTMLALIYDFLELDVMQHDEIVVHQEAVDLSELVDSLYHEYALIAIEKNITLDVNIPQVTVLADYNRFRQCLANFISNAIKYSPFDKTIYISHENQLDHVVIHVIDEGSGIPEAEVANLFTAFSRISTQPTNGEHSTGLGLWSVKQIAEAQGGTVGYQRATTGGADFWFSIPTQANASTTRTMSTLEQSIPY